MRRVFRFIRAICSLIYRKNTELAGNTDRGLQIKTRFKGKRAPNINEPMMAEVRGGMNKFGTWNKCELEQIESVESLQLWQSNDAPHGETAKLMEKR